MVEQKHTHTVQPNLPVFLERASLAVFVFCTLLNIAERRQALLCNFNEIYTKGRFYEIIFWKLQWACDIRCYNEFRKEV